MQKIILSVALVMGLGIASISAQTLNFGVKGEANMSNFLLSDMDNMKSTFGVGASLGGFTIIELSEHFALQPELLFHFKNSKMEEKNTGAKMDYQYFGAELPIYAVGQFKLPNNERAYIGIGPYFGFGFDARYKAEGMDDVKLYNEIGNTDESAMQRWDVGVGAMIGYEFAFGMQINASYKMGFINALDAGKDDASMLNQTISLGIGFRF